MKKLLSLLLLIACGCGANSYYLDRNFERNHTMTKTIGSSMLMTERTTRNANSSKPIETFRRELIYSGRAGDVIKIVYREYWDNIARQPFTQELQYDLSKAKIIKFRDTSIEVLDATNENITYKVLSSPSLFYKTGEIPAEDVNNYTDSF